WNTGTPDDMEPHIRPQAFAYQVLVACRSSERGDDVHLRAERGNVIGRGKDTPRKGLEILKPGGDDAFLRWLAHGQYVLIFIDDRIADQHYAVVFYAIDELGEFCQTVVGSKSIQVVANMRLEDVKVPVDQLGGAKYDLVGKMDPPTPRFH